MATCCERVHLVVHYIAAERPFHDQDASPSETLGHLKTRVMKAFGLHEGPTDDGNQTVYNLHERREPLENLNQTLGELAGTDCGLQLKLVQQIIQGAVRE